MALDACFSAPHAALRLNATHLVVIDDGTYRHDGSTRCSESYADGKAFWVGCFSRALMLEVRGGDRSWLVVDLEGVVVEMPPCSRQSWR